MVIVPWSSWCAVIKPHDPKAGNGRAPMGLECMLRIHFIQHGFKLADMACEEALYDSASLRRFVGIDLGAEPVPDCTTITKFRRLLNDNKLGQALFAKVGKQLQARGFKVNTGTLVEAHPHWRTELHQERRQGRVTPRCTRPGKASSVVLWNETPHRRGQPKWLGP